MPIYPYSFQLPPLNVQDIPNDGVAGEFLGINGSGALDWLPVATGGGDMLKSENLSGLANYATARTNIGLGTASTPTFANLTLTSPSLTASAPVTISQTWNAGSNVMTALRLNVTDTASGSTSKLLELYAGATPVSVFEIDKIGRLRIGSTAANAHGTRTNPAFRFANNNSGFYTNVANGYINYAGSGSSPLCFSPAGIILSAGAYFQWTSGVNDPLDSSTVELALLRDAANTLALRNGINPQTFRVYNTYSNAGVDVEYLQLSTSASGFRIGTNSSGSGSPRALFLGVGGGTQWQINTSGHIGTYGSDNLYDIGASGANRPRSLYVGTSLVVGTTPSLLLTINNAGFKFDNRFIISETGQDGNIAIYNSTISGFNRLMFGGVNASFPAIKRNGANFDIVLANDTGFTAVQDLYRRFGAGTPENAVTAPIGAVFHRTDGGAGTSFYVKESGTGNTGWVAK